MLRDILEGRLEVNQLWGTGWEEGVTVHRQRGVDSRGDLVSWLCGVDITQEVGQHTWRHTELAVGLGTGSGEDTCRLHIEKTARII